MQSADRARRELTGWAVAWAVVGAVLWLVLGFAPGAAALVMGCVCLGLVAARVGAVLPPGAAWANRVTLLRAVLVSVVLAQTVRLLLSHEPPSLGFLTVGGLALALDSVDGHVARSTGSVSSVGARFDVELDAWLVLVLSVAATTAYGAVMLVPGLAYYVFRLAGLVWPWLRHPLPPSTRRRVIGALLGVALLAIAAQVLPPQVSPYVMALTVVAPASSFGWDVTLLRRQRDRR